MSKKKEEKKEEKTLSKEDRLELQNMRLRVAAMDGKLEAFRQRQNFLMLELSVINEKLPESEKEKTELSQKLSDALRDVLIKLDLPENSQIDLETGEILSQR